MGAALDNDRHQPCSARARAPAAAHRNIPLLRTQGRRRAGPTAGFVYKRKQNQKGEEIGGIVPHVTLKSIANDEPPEEEVLVDRPEVTNSITRVTGPFCVEATIPTPVDYEAATTSQNDGTDDYGSFIDRMLEVAAQVARATSRRRQEGHT